LRSEETHWPQRSPRAQRKQFATKRAKQSTDYSGEIVKGEWVEEARDANLDGDLVIRMPMPEFELPEKSEFVE
jgi:hypothetical protein